MAFKFQILFSTKEKELNAKKPQDENADEEYSREEIINCQQQYEHLYAESQNCWDKNVLSFSLAAIGLTTSFKDDLIGKSACSLYLLVIAWSLFCIAAMVTMISYVTAANSARYCSKQISQGRLPSQLKQSRLDSVTSWLNWGSLICFCIALISFIVSVSITLFDHE